MIRVKTQKGVRSVSKHVFHGIQEYIYIYKKKMKKIKHFANVFNILAFAALISIEVEKLMGKI